MWTRLKTGQGYLNLNVRLIKKINSSNSHKYYDIATCNIAEVVWVPLAILRFVRQNEKEIYERFVQAHSKIPKNNKFKAVFTEQRKDWVSWIGMQIGRLFADYIVNDAYDRQWYTVETIHESQRNRWVSVKTKEFRGYFRKLKKKEKEKATKYDEISESIKNSFNLK